MEETYDVIPVGVRYICDICKKGEMLPTGTNTWSIDPPTFLHECNNCDENKHLTAKYPIIRYYPKDVK